MTNDHRGKVMTVSGPIAPEDVGLCLMHEHVFIRLFEVDNRWDIAGLVDDDDLMASELGKFTDQGGKTLVDLTLPGIGKSPARLKAMSERTGLNIVMGCGWYRQPYYPPEAKIDRRTVDSLADELVREIEHGAGDTGVRPGIIGEIGTDKPWVSAQEERVHRAAARASLATSLAVVTHALKSDVGSAQLDIFEDEGLDLTRVIVGHADTYPLPRYHQALLDRGATLGFDTFSNHGPELREHLANVIADLVGKGYAGQIVLSQDVCKEPHLTAWGGEGYAYMVGRLLPRLRELGVREGHIREMTIENPKRLLTRK